MANSAQSWNGDFTFNGTQNLNMGTGPVTLGSNRIVTVNANTLTVNGLISDGGNGFSLTKAGPGTLTLTAANTYGGGTNISGGTLIDTYASNAGNTNQSGLGSLSALSTISVNSGAALVLAAGNAFSAGQFNSTWTLAINSGMVTSTSLSSNNNLNNVVFSGGTLQTNNGVQGSTQYESYNINGSVTVTGTSPSYIVPVANTTFNGITLGASQGPGYQTLFTVNSTGAGGPDLTVAVPMADSSGPGSSGFIKQGNGLLLLTASNIYTGATELDSGTLQLGTGQNGQDGSIATTSGVADNAGLVYDLAGSQTAAYAISGTGTLTMDGPGQLVLSGVNTYSGGTFVTNGQLQIANPTAIQDGSNLFVGSGTIFAPIVGGAAVPSAAPASAVPEPGTLAILAAVGALSALRIVRRRQRRKSALERKCLIASCSRTAARRLPAGRA